MIAAAGGRRSRIDGLYQLEAATIAGLERAQGSAPLTALEAVRTMVDTYLEHFEHPSDEERALLVLWGATFPSHASVGAVRAACHQWITATLAP